MNQPQPRRPFDPLPIPHYHAFAGRKGFIPSVSIPCETAEEAAGRLAKLGKLDEESRHRLQTTWWLDFGSSYAKIAECHDSCTAEGIE